MHKTKQQENFSDAFIKAITAVAGYGATKPSNDIDSIDWTISGINPSGRISRPKLDIQLKCCGQEDALKSKVLVFPVKFKNYNDLREKNERLGYIPRLLVVVRVPNDLNKWVTESEDNFILNHCAYWYSLEGREETSNKKTVTVHIPRSQAFNVESLKKIMNNISNQKMPKNQE